jgi:hypothetical protein
MVSLRLNIKEPSRDMKLPILAVLMFAVALSACIQSNKVEYAFPHQEKLFTVSSTCSPRHSNIRTLDGKDVSIYSDWQQTVHSNAATDPYWQAKMSSEIVELPQLKEVIEKDCAVCHMPLARTQAIIEGEEVAIFGGFLDSDHELHDFAMEGVSCTLCHQIKDENLGVESSFSGKYVIDGVTEKPYREIYGPFKPLWSVLMVRESGYTPVEGIHIQRAELCAICHTLYTPYVDERGEIAGKFPEQTPFLEWLNSDYSPNVTCQQCHMPAAKAPVSSKPGKLPPRDMRRHYFVGANVQMLKIVGDTKGAERTRAQLESAARIRVESVELRDDGIKVKVKVENFAGHKFPTGFPSRRAWIHLVVYDATGVIFESGRVDEDGRIFGEDEPYERHHDVISSDDEVQIYESVMMDVKGSVTRTLLKAAGYVKDNRILPAGFDKLSPHPDTGVRGLALDDVNFVEGSDVVTYLIEGNFEKPLKIRAELLYQPISYPFVKSLVTTGLTEKFLENFSKIEKTSLVSSDEKIVDQFTTG